MYVCLYVLFVMFVCVSVCLSVCLPVCMYVCHVCNFARLYVALENGELTISQLYDPKLEEQVQVRLSKLDDVGFERHVQQCKKHPEFEAYCKAVRVEIGDDETPCAFGEEEPYEDVLGFETYVLAKQRLRDGLALPKPVPAGLETYVSAKLQLDEALAAAEPPAQRPKTNFFVERQGSPDATFPAPGPKPPAPKCVPLLGSGVAPAPAAPSQEAPARHQEGRKGPFGQPERH